MKEFDSIEDILEFAIKNEQQAADFYNNLAKNSTDSVMKETFLQYAREEKGHKARLEKIKAGGAYTLKSGEVMDLKIGDYLVASKVSDKMSYQDALILAMKREKAAYKLYMKLSEKAPSLEFEILFRDLAIEEAKHKLKFETEYDDVILREN
jgi:rubrerythrin